MTEGATRAKHRTSTSSSETEKEKKLRGQVKDGQQTAKDLRKIAADKIGPTESE